MRLIFSLIFLFSLVLPGLTQVNNPFEIQSRLDSLYNPDKAEKSSSANVFDVQREDDATVRHITPTTIDTLESEEESVLVPQVGEDEIQFSEEVTDQNPFDVSHIPIRKSKLKNEADAFKSRVKRENEKESGSNAFLFFLNLLSAFLLAVVINTEKGVLKKISNAITNENVLKLMHREEKRGISGYNLLLYISYFINAAIFVYLIGNAFFKAQGWKYYQMIFLVILGIYLGRHLFLNILGNLFPIKKDSQLYGFTIQTFNIFLGLILIPLNLIIAFGPEKIAVPLIYVGLVFIGILALLRTFRGFLIATSYIQSNLFHFLLYLCTFEILPILLLIKIIGNFGIA